MSDIIQFKTGTGIPTTATAGRPLFRTDTHTLGVGDGTQNFWFTPLGAGLVTLAAGGVVFGDSAGHLVQSTGLTFDGAHLNVQGPSDASNILGVSGATRLIFGVQDISSLNGNIPAVNLQVGPGGGVGYATIGGSGQSDPISRLDVSANQIYLNGVVNPQGDVSINREGDSGGVSAQQPSHVLLLQQSGDLNDDSIGLRATPRQGDSGSIALEVSVDYWIGGGTPAVHFWHHRTTVAPVFDGLVLGPTMDAPRALLDVRGDVTLDGAVHPGSMPDSGSGAPGNNSLYYSTTQNKLVYKDASGTINALY